MSSRCVLALCLTTSLALMLLACGDRQADEWPERRQVHGEFSLGDATLRYVATYQDSMLLTVQEEQDFGALGQADAHYEVVDGRLAYYRFDERRRLPGEDDSGGFEEMVVELEFDAAGRVRRHTKLVDGEPVELVGYEAPGALRHFAELKKRVDLAQDAAVGGM